MAAAAALLCACSNTGSAKEKDTIIVAFTGDVIGEYTTCGCKHNPSGGLAKRAKFFQDLRAQYPNVLAFDLGNQLHKNREYGDGQTAKENARADLFVRSLNHMKLTAAVPGPLDFALGVDAFRDAHKKMEFPLLAGNARYADGGPAFKDTLVVKAGEYRVGVIGLASAKFEHRGVAVDHGGLKIDDPAGYAKSALPALAKETDIVIAVGNLDDDEVEDVLKKTEGINFFLAAGTTGRFTRDFQEVDGVPVFRMAPRGRQVGVLEIAPVDHDFHFTNRTEIEHIRDRVARYEKITTRMEKQAGGQDVEEYYADSPSAQSRYRALKGKLAEERKKLESASQTGSYFLFKQVNLGEDRADDMQVNGWATKFSEAFGADS
ncbi:MAG: hypothetical protein M5R36_26705 [Deltaproteobacteria bacterium]|nr:hypothetical protein [Deltaproteobacteria bacterium]